MTKLYSDNYVVGSLKIKCLKLGSQKAAAEWCGLSPAYISDILRGNRDIPERLANMLGYGKIQGWVKI